MRPPTIICMVTYEKDESWHIISQLLTTLLEFSFITVQMIIGGLIPLILLAVVVLMNRYLHEKVRNTLATVAAFLTLIQVFSMRWNIVIGGQLLSKSLRGLRSPYEPEMFGREGVLMAIALFVAPFVILWVFDRVLGIEEPEGSGGHGNPPAAPVEASAASHVP